MCTHPRLSGVWNGAVVAIKVLEHLQHDDNPEFPDKEAILNGQLSHPNIVSPARVCNVCVHVRVCVRVQYVCACVCLRVGALEWQPSDAKLQARLELYTALLTLFKR